MKKKLLSLALLTVFVSLMALGTAAYFSAEGRATNVITTGNVKVELHEWADEAKTEPFKDVTGVMPGASVTKIVEVENIGVGEAWVRVQVTKAIDMEDPDLSLIVIDFDEENWTQGEDGWWYCNAPLAAGETTEPLFEHVSFEGKMNNDYQSKTATVTVKAQAVQTANNGETVFEAKGWPKEAE